jgi:hypothetical protein
VARGSGFSWEGFNSFEETARTEIKTLEESNMLPRFLLRAIDRRLQPHKGYLRFKLDWFLARKLRPLKEGQTTDSGSAIASKNPGCLEMLNYGAGRISDHLPIFVDVDLNR